MSELSLTWVPAGEHTAADMEYILQADEAQPIIERIPLLQMEHGLLKGTMQLFRLNPGPGVVVTEIRSAYGHKRLALLRGAGRAAHQIRSVMKLLEATAREWGCECVETVVYSDRLKRALELSGAEVEGWILKYSAEEAAEKADGQ